MIVANDVTGENTGFGSDQNQATIITRAKAAKTPLMSKQDLANKILDEIVNLRRK